MQQEHLNCAELNSKQNGTKWKTVSWAAPVPCMVFCTPVISPSILSNETSTNSNLTMIGDEVGKTESIKLRDGTQCTVDDKDDRATNHDGICIAGRCQVSICMCGNSEILIHCRNWAAINNFIRWPWKMNAVCATEIEVIANK